MPLVITVIFSGTRNVKSPVRVLNRRDDGTEYDLPEYSMGQPVALQKTLLQTAFSKKG